MFKTVSTNWIVLTGSTCSGKSTTCGLLEEIGFSAIGDVETLLAQAIAHKSADASADSLNFRGIAYKESLHKEAVFLKDRAAEPIILESCAFNRALALRRLGGRPELIEPNIARAKYGQIFLLERLPFVTNGIRPYRNEEYREFIEDSIERDFIEAGYDVMRVPVMAREDRVSFILENVHATSIRGRALSSSKA